MKKLIKSDMRELTKRSGQFLLELNTVKDWREIADLPAVYDYALELLNAYNIEKYDYAADIEEHIRFLIDACEQLEGWLEQWKWEPGKKETDYWQEKWKLIEVWELISPRKLNEREIRDLYEERMKYINANWEDLKYRCDEFLNKLGDLLEDIGIAEAERAAELKDCEGEPDWDYLDYMDKKHREELEIEEQQAKHILEAIPPVEVRAELTDKKEFERKQQEEERWEAFFSNLK